MGHWGLRGEDAERQTGCPPDARGRFDWAPADTKRSDGRGALPLGARYLWIAARLRHDERLALPAFRYSIVYLAGLFALLLADHYLPAWPGVGAP